MFKLIKILNSHTSAPDLFTVEVNTDTEVIPGDALAFYDGEVIPCPETDVPVYISAGYSKGGKACVYSVNDDMVFEATRPIGNIKARIGDRYPIGIDDRGGACFIGEEEGEGPIVIREIHDDKYLIVFSYQ